jgi:hypothetical protein
MDNIFKFVPAYLEAPTRDALIKGMLERNLKDGMSYRYFDIQYDMQSKVWVAWFYPEKERVGVNG